MSLATRCTACGTVFRVVPDQLRVSDGWVRCGRCDAVFDAAETLFDIDHGEPVVLEGLGQGGMATENPDHPAAPPEPAVPARAATVRPHHAEHPPTRAPRAPDPAPPPALPHSPEDDPLRDVVPADWHDHQRRREIAARVAAAGPDMGPAPLLHTHSADGVDVDLSADGQLAADNDASRRLRPPRSGLQALWARLKRRPVAVRGLLAATAARAQAVAASVAVATGDTDGNAPAFLRAAERAVFWRQPAVRAALSVGALLLAATLALQVGLLWRDALAAHVPVLAPSLHSLCKLAGCRVQPLRRIEHLSVDSSSLNKVEGAALYRLQLLLRNRADTAVMMPALDLTLTDNQGRLVSRRVLQGAELGLSLAALERGQELPIQAVLSTEDRAVEGYTLELFYP